MKIIDIHGKNINILHTMVESVVLLLWLLYTEPGNVTCDGCLAYQSRYLVISLDSGMSRGRTSTGVLDGECWTLTCAILGFPFHFSFLSHFCSKLIESVRMMAGVVWLWPHEVIQRGSLLHLHRQAGGRDCRLHCLHGMHCTVTPCSTIKPWLAFADPAISVN